jgi:hypothetical protein
VLLHFDPQDWPVPASVKPGWRLHAARDAWRRARTEWCREHGISPLDLVLHARAQRRQP